MKFHTFEFKTRQCNGCNTNLTDVFIDGKRMEGVLSADISYRINEIPTVKLEFIAGRTTGSLEQVEIGGDSVE